MSKTELIAVAGTEAVNRIADIVFVHGLDGDKQTTWQFEDLEETFWPRLLFNDLPNCGVWSFGYDARSSKWLGQTMPIVDRATNFAAFLQSEGIGERPVFFVVHSLGGLVVKQMLRGAYDVDPESPLTHNTKTVFFFATPHFGSSVSNFVHWLKFYRPSALVEELESCAAPLRDLNAWYQSNSVRLDIQTVVFRETQKMKNLALVVDERSSDPGITGVKPIPVDADHSEICKVGLDDMAYKTVRNSIQASIRTLTPDIELSRTTDLWMDLACLNKYPDQWEEKSKPKGLDRILSYELEKHGSRIQIEPRLPYLDAVRAADPVWSIDMMWQPFRWLPVTLDLKFLNRSLESSYITELQLLVEESKPSEEPVLFVRSSNAFPYLQIENDGWGSLSNVELRLNFEDGKAQPKYPDEFTHVLKLEDFEDVSEVDLSEVFSELGVDVERIMNWDKTASLGPFTSGVVFVYGELRFSQSESAAGTFRFGTDFRIEGPLCEMYGPPTFEYQTRLRCEGSNYSLSVPVSHIIKPGESDRLLLQLGVEKSSNHRLSIVANGSKPGLAHSAPIDLSMFVPRSVAGQISEPEKVFGPQ